MLTSGRRLGFLRNAHAVRRRRSAFRVAMRIVRGKLLAAANKERA